MTGPTAKPVTPCRAGYYEIRRNSGQDTGLVSSFASVELTPFTLPAAPSSPWCNSGCIRPAMHPRGLRCSSFKYSRYSQSSRLARGAPRRSRCDAGLAPRAASLRNPSHGNPTIRHIGLFVGRSRGCAARRFLGTGFASLARFRATGLGSRVLPSRTSARTALQTPAPRCFGIPWPSTLRQCACDVWALSAVAALLFRHRRLPRYALCALRCRRRPGLARERPRRGVVRLWGVCCCVPVGLTTIAKSSPPRFPRRCAT
jgi:hypothetical protein